MYGLSELVQDHYPRESLRKQLDERLNLHVSRRDDPITHLYHTQTLDRLPVLTFIISLPTNQLYVCSPRRQESALRLTM